MPREFTFLGRKFQTPTEEELEEQVRQGELHPYIISRVADSDDRNFWPALRARRRQTTCEECGEACWYDPKSLQEFGRLRLIWMCTQCAPGWIRRHQGGS